jgi:hypothetical protein
VEEERLKNLVKLGKKTTYETTGEDEGWSKISSSRPVVRSFYRRENLRAKSIEINVSCTFAAARRTRQETDPSNRSFPSLLSCACACAHGACAHGACGPGKPAHHIFLFFLFAFLPFFFLISSLSRWTTKLVY